MEETLAALSRVRLPLLAGCDAAALARIEAFADRIEVDAGEPLLRARNGGRHLFVIVQGEASVATLQGHLARLGPGDFFGEVAALSLVPRTAMVTAATPMVLLVVDESDTEAFIAEPSIAARMLRTALARLRSTEMQLPYGSARS